MKTIRTFFLRFRFYVLCFFYVFVSRVFCVVVSRLFLFLRFRFGHKVNIHNVFFTFSESLGVFALSGSGCPCFFDLSTKSSRKEYSGLNRPARIKRQELSFFNVFVYRRRSVCECFFHVFTNVFSTFSWGGWGPRTRKTKRPNTFPDGNEQKTP